MDETVKQKSQGRKYAGLTSILLFLILIPLLILFGWNVKTYDYIWFDYTFVIMMAPILIYGVYEITNFVFPRNDNSHFWRYFVLISIFQIFIFLFFSLNFIANFNYDNFAIDNKNLFDTNNNIFSDNIIAITIVLFLIFTIIYFLFEYLTNNDIRDSFTIYIVSTLLSLFLISIILISKIFNWVFVLMIILTTAATDTFAYFGGKKFGKTKAFPNISPNKTIEGLMIGLVGAFAFAMLWFFGVIYWTDLSNWHEMMEGSSENYVKSLNTSFVVLTILIFITFAPLGDLFFSKIKRSYGKKDFAKILPGHGGLFDRIDSHIFTMTISSLFLTLYFVII